MRFSTLIKFIRNPRLCLYRFINKYPWIIKNDKSYIKYLWNNRMDYPLDLDNPKTYNEKLQWLKLYNKDKTYTALVDKYEVKEYVSKRIGGQYIIKTLGVWDSFDEIDFDSLPNQFVLKCTHDSGGIVICKDKMGFNKAAAKKKIEKSLKSDYYMYAREWPYKNVRRRIIAEEYMEDSVTKELRDYKFFCFDGDVEWLFIATDRQNREEPYFDFFDKDYNHLPLKHGHPNSPIPPQKPSCFDEMKLLATKLSSGFPHVRVDFYEVNGKVYFGELTFFHHSGMVPFEPREWDYKFGEHIKLSKTKIQ